MIPTDDNIKEVATVRRKAIEKAGGTVEQVIKSAIVYATRKHHSAESAEQAVAWAITDLPDWSAA
jgi:hypothetical protein